MCGIVGLVSLGRPLDPARLTRANDVLAHRGPDGARVWVGDIGANGQVGLGHRRLSILDLSERSAQPLMIDARGSSHPVGAHESSEPRAVMVYNGEVYNFVELRSELTALGHRFSSTGDAEVLLRAYAEWGDTCVQRINGMFAFAIWDQERRRLFCARDRFGEKPLYYVSDASRGLFAFASEVKALVTLGVASTSLDERAVYRYLEFGEQAGVPQTVWSNVTRLLPASTLVVQAEGERASVAVQRYWDARPEDESEIDEAEAAEQFRELFRDSVRLRLRSDVTVGTSLSGGLDSSSVVCQLRELGVAAGQKAFTARMTDPRLDEGRFVDAVLHQTGIEGHSVTPTAESFTEAMDTLFFHQEEPFPTTSIFAQFEVQRLAAAHAVTVLLDGQGADEYLAGYEHYPAVVLYDQARRRRVVQWFQERRAVRNRLHVDPVPPRAFLRMLLNRRTPHSLTVDATHECKAVSPDFRHRFRSEMPRELAINGDALKSRLYADLTLGHLQELLRYADRNSMAFSREIRLPFLDHRLVEFSLSLPRRYLLDGGESKRILRRAMGPELPAVVRDRTDKVGFTTPWRDWWKGSSGDLLRERLVAAEATLQGLVTPGAAQPGSREALSILSLAAAKDLSHKVGAPLTAGILSPA